MAMRKPERNCVKCIKKERKAKKKTIIIYIETMYHYSATFAFHAMKIY